MLQKIAIDLSFKVVLIAENEEDALSVVRPMLQGVANDLKAGIAEEAKVYNIFVTSRGQVPSREIRYTTDGKEVKNA